MELAERKAARSAPRKARLLSLLTRAIALLPLPVARAIGSFLGSCLASIPNQQRAITRLNLRLCFPELDDGERRRLEVRSLQETGKTLLEMGALWHWPPVRLAALEGEVIGGDRLEDALATRRGVLLITPHLGNWELLNTVLMRHGQLNCLYRRPRMVELQDALCRARGRTGCVSIPASRGGVRQALRALRGGELLLILPDQEPLKAHGVFAPFFGVPALTMTLVAQLLRRTDAVPLFVFTRRRPDGRFAIHFEPAPSGLAADDPVRAASRLNQGLERCIRQDPEQYLWSYKRFKTAPPGEPTPYREIWTRRQRRRREERLKSN